jgi:hypothetical protein
MIYLLSSNSTDSVGEAPLYRCDPRSLGQVIRGIHIFVTAAPSQDSYISGGYAESAWQTWLRS